MTQILSNKVLILLVVVVLIFTAFFVPLDVVAGDDFHTGISPSTINNSETVHKKYHCNIFNPDDCWYGNYLDDYEEMLAVPFNNGPCTTSMVSGMGARSMPIVAIGEVGCYTNEKPIWIPTLGYYTVEITNNGVLWTEILNTKDGPIDDTYIGNVVMGGSGTIGGWLDYAESLQGDTHKHIYILPTLSFTIKDTQVGALRVKQHTMFWKLGGYEDLQVTSIDYCYLISGWGNVDLALSQTRYIAGEDTVKFKVDTYYSGYTQGGEYSSNGWKLKLYDNTGGLVKEWDIDDDKQGTRYDNSGNLLDYFIPESAVQTGQSHTWRVVLTNTLFDQDDETFFTVTLEELLGAPGIKPIEFNQQGYQVGDKARITLEGIPNPLGKNYVDGFLVNVMYGTDGTDYILDYHNKYVSVSSSNKVVLEFTCAKGDTYICVEAWAFDAPEATGGIMSEKQADCGWVEEFEPEPGEDMLGLVIAILIFVIFLVLSTQIKGKKQIFLKALVIIIGAVVAVIVYAVYTGFEIPFISSLFGYFF